MTRERTDELPHEMPPRSGRRIFLIDGAGALLTCALLLLLLRPRPDLFGIPGDLLVALAVAAGALCAFAISSFLFASSQRLAILIGANIAYGASTLAVLAVHHARLTVFDIAYFGAELAVIACLVVAEARILRAWRRTIRAGDLRQPAPR